MDFTDLDVNELDEDKLKEEDMEFTELDMDLLNVDFLQDLLRKKYQVQQSPETIRADITLLQGAKQKNLMKLHLHGSIQL